MTDSLPNNDMGFRQIQDYIDRMVSLSTPGTNTLGGCNRFNTTPNDLCRMVPSGPVPELVNAPCHSLLKQILPFTRAIIFSHSFST